MWWTKNKTPRKGSALAAQNNLLKERSNQTARNFYCKSKNAGSKVPSNNGYYAKTNTPTNAWIEKHCDKPDEPEDPRPAHIVAPISNTESVSDPGTPRGTRRPGTTRKTLEANVKRAHNAVNAAKKNEYGTRYSPENRARQARTLKAAKNALSDFIEIHL